MGRAPRLPLPIARLFHISETPKKLFKLPAEVTIELHVPLLLISGPSRRLPVSRRAFLLARVAGGGNNG
jgi:hypothetical protein